MKTLKICIREAVVFTSLVVAVIMCLRVGEYIGMLLSITGMGFQVASINERLGDKNESGNIL